MPWEEVEDAAWDLDAERLRVTGVGEYGRPRPSYAFEMDDPALLLQLVRERVTASIVLQRRVPVRDRLGVTVIGRRSPAGGPVRWMHAYDPGLDPAGSGGRRGRRPGPAPGSLRGRRGLNDAAGNVETVI